MITNRQALKATFRSPPLLAYSLIAGVVFLGRELDLINEFLLGSTVGVVESPMIVFGARTVMNSLIGIVWPRFLYVTLEPIPFAVVVGGYLALVLFIRLTPHPRME